MLYTPMWRLTTSGARVFIGANRAVTVSGGRRGFGRGTPLLFKRLGLDPALMSNPFVAGLIDIVGIVIYLNVAIQLL